MNVSQFNALVVWRKFTEFYGSAWLSEFGEQPNQSWIEELAQLSPCDIETGLNQCKHFAPRLPQFLAYCTPTIIEDVYRQERETRERYLLPKPKASETVRQAAMAQIRKELKILVMPTASKEALEQRQAAMIQAAENLIEQQEVTA